MARTGFRTSGPYSPGYVRSPNRGFSFEADLEAFADKMGLEYGQAVAKVVHDLDTKIVLRTPVDTGWARMNWNISADSPDTSYTPATRPVEEPIGEEEATRIALVHAQLWLSIILADPYHTFYIANAIPYIDLLEDGHSGQSPNGMVAVSLAEVEAGIL